MATASTLRLQEEPSAIQDTDESFGDVDALDPGLSPRERAVVLLFATGRTTAAIAEALKISQATVNQYLARARAKYEAVGRSARTRHDLYQRTVEDFRSLKGVFSDAELMDAVRYGVIDAYGQLYKRHVSAARNLARNLARSSVEADDLVADAFAKLLDTLRAGGGPDSAFRAYLLTALRHTAYDKTGREGKFWLIGQPDEDDLRRWARADLTALRDDLDLVLNQDASSSGSARPGRSGRPPSDAELIDAVRGGEIQAYGQLFERHVGAARNLARHLAWSAAEADDLVSDAFAKVLDALRAGRGPDSAFRAYLLTALRHTAYDKTRRDKKLKLADDVEAVSGVEKVTTVPFHDPALATLERSLASRAFASLPERWQTVLWQTEIEGQSAAELASELGLTVNGVSALAYRAREGLKQAYLKVHLAETRGSRCRATVAKLGAWTRSGLTRRETAQVEAHLEECADCRALAAELADVNVTLR